MITITGTILKAGEVSFEIDPSSILKTLEVLEKQTAPVFGKLALDLGIPAEPLDKKLLKPVLMGEVQNAWYQTFQGNIPEKCVANQASRLTRYKQQLEELKANGGEDLVVGRKAKATATGAAAKTSNTYRLASATEDVWGKFSGQKFIIVQTMRDLGAVGPEGKGVTVRQIFEGQKQYPGIVPPSDKNCAFHINKFGHDGIIERLDGDGKVAETQQPKAETKPKDEKPAAEKKPAKATSKKK